MRDQVELSAAIRLAMREKKLAPEVLGKKLGVSPIMLDKIMCGDVVPSRHLEKQMIEVLEIEPDRVKNLASRRQKRSGGAVKRPSEKREAA
jgi:ribosome-binding protein aMBF1 (putative translation factor)